MPAPLSDSALQTRLERLRRRLAHAEEAHRNGQAEAPEVLSSLVRAAEQAAAPTPEDISPEDQDRALGSLVP